MAPDKGRTTGHPQTFSLTIYGLPFRSTTHNLKVLDSNASPATLRPLKGAFFFSMPPDFGFEPVIWCS